MSKFWKKNEITKDTTKETKYVSISTYASEEEIRRIIEEKKEYIKGVSYIYHDKDESTPHTHIALELKRSRKGGQILRWFDGAKDRANPDTVANTKAQEVISVSALHDYFTHSDPDSRQQGKHQYTENDIKCIEGISDAWSYVTAWEKAEERAEEKEQKADETEQLLQDIIDHVPQREMCRRYGRDYMKNYQSYKNFASLVVLEETGDFERALRMRDTFEEKFVHKARHEAATRAVEYSWNIIKHVLDNNAHPEEADFRKALNVDEKGRYIIFD